MIDKFKPQFQRSLKRIRRDDETKHKDFLSSELISHDLPEAIKKFGVSISLELKIFIIEGTYKNIRAFLLPGMKNIRTSIVK